MKEEHLQFFFPRDLEDSDVVFPRNFLHPQIFDLKMLLAHTPLRNTIPTASARIDFVLDVAPLRPETPKQQVSRWVPRLRTCCCATQPLLTKVPLVFEADTLRR